MSDKDEPPFEKLPQPDGMDLGKVHDAILREHNEPAEGYESVPLWLVGIIMALVFWGGSYLAFYSGDFRADEFLPRRDMASAPVDTNDPVAFGRSVFTQNCILCHQANGAGIPGLYPPLAGSEWVVGRDWRGDNHLVNIVLFGLQGPVQVGDKTFNDAMPGWKSLRDDEVAAVLTYIRSQWGNSAPAITPQFVKSIREANAARDTAWTATELKSFPAIVAPAETPQPIMKARQ